MTVCPEQPREEHWHRLHLETVGFFEALELRPGEIRVVGDEVEEKAQNVVLAGGHRDDGCAVSKRLTQAS